MTKLLNHYTMIKRLFVALMLVITAVSASAQKSKYFAWGVEAGMNFNSLSFSRSDFDSSNRLGFFVGPKVRAKIPLLGFGADAALLYSLNSAKVSGVSGGEVYAESKSLSYFEIPLNVRYDFDLRILTLYLATGPQFNYCMSTDNTLAELYGGDLAGYSRSTWGWNIGAGVEVFSHLQIGLTYTIPISENGSLKAGDISNVFTNFKQKTVKVRLAYYF